MLGAGYIEVARRFGRRGRLEGLFVVKHTRLVNVRHTEISLGLSGSLIALIGRSRVLEADRGGAQV